jgi:hypothetical protein
MTIAVSNGDKDTWCYGLKLESIVANRAASIGVIDTLSTWAKLTHHSMFSKQKNATTPWLNDRAHHKRYAHD